MADTPPIKSVNDLWSIGMPPGGREKDNRKRKDSGKVERFLIQGFAASVMMIDSN